MSIPDISIPKIDIPNIPVQVIPPISVFNDYVTNPALKEPSLMLPGCYKTHRDADKNSNLINDDPTGAFWSCPWGEVPEISPIEFVRSQRVYSIDVKEEKKNEDQKLNSFIKTVPMTNDGKRLRIEANVDNSDEVMYKAVRQYPGGYIDNQNLSIIHI